MELIYSVIIPAFNAEKTIGRCLDSLLHQAKDRNDIEIIIINDGSFDNTDKICEEYLKTYNCIRYHRNSRKGVSAARNTGLDYAKGKYILFVDSDDYVLDNFFSILDKEINKDTDLFIFGIKNNKRNIDCKQICCESSNKTARYLSKCIKQQKLNAIYGKLFKYDIIQKYEIRFPEGLQIGEDKVFVLSYIIHIESVKTSEDKLYAVCLDNNDSLSRKRRDDLCPNVLKEHRLLKSVTEQIKEDKVRYKQYEKAVSYSFYRSAYSVINELNKYRLDNSEKMSLIGGILSIYNDERIHYQDSPDTLLIGLPIIIKAKHLINWIVCIARGNL